jgi:hypothetical protein
MNGTEDLMLSEKCQSGKCFLSYVDSRSKNFKKGMTMKGRLGGEEKRRNNIHKAHGMHIWEDHDETHLKGL